MLGLGLLELLGGWLITRGRSLAILVAITVVLASLVHGYAAGRGFNLVSLVLGGLFLAWMIVLWRRGALAQAWQQPLGRWRALDVDIRHPGSWSPRPTWPVLTGWIRWLTARVRWRSIDGESARRRRDLLQITPP